MKTPVDRLTQEEREILAHYYSSEGFKVLVKLIEMERLDLAKDHVEQVDILQVRYLSGQAASLKKLVKTIQQLKKNSKES